MRALTWNGSVAEVTDRAEPRLDPGMALVRVSLAGVCSTDLQIVKGYMGFHGVLGHEFVGRVTDGAEELRGKRVVGEINFGCASCPACRQGLQRHCPNRRVMGILNADGAFAELVAVPAANLHVVPDSVSDDAAVFTEPLAAAFEILEQVHVRPGIDTAVLGDGKLGLLVAQVLYQAGARVRLIGRHPEKLRIAQRRGIEAVDRDTWRREKMELVVEATGTADGFAEAVRATRPRGTLVLKSTVAERSHVDLAPLVIDEINVVGSRCGSFVPALRALESGSVDVRSLITKRRPLREAAEALGEAAAPGVLKVLVETAAGT